MQGVLPPNQGRCRVGDVGAAGLVQEPARAGEPHLGVTSSVSLSREQRPRPSAFLCSVKTSSLTECSDLWIGWMFPPVWMWGKYFGMNSVPEMDTYVSTWRPLCPGLVILSLITGSRWGQPDLAPGKGPSGSQQVTVGCVSTSSLDEASRLAHAIVGTHLLHSPVSVGFYHIAFSLESSVFKQ